MDDIERIKSAAARLSGVAVKTPLLNIPDLDRRTGGTVFIKPEPLQRTGSFKFRGAYNRISQIPSEDRDKGVVAFSSGNHAQGVAHASQLLGLPATIVMPSDAPRMKVENTRGYGATVQLYDRYFESRESIAADIVERTGATLIKPYDDPEVIAGQGSCGLEIAQDLQLQSRTIDSLLVCCGGGGLTAGSAVAVHASMPSAEIYTVEPEGFDDHAKSLIAGHRVRNEGGRHSICDALLAPMPGEITFAVNRNHLAGGLSVSDDDVRAAMKYAYQHLKLVLEPGGAVTLAALLQRKIETRNKRIAIILSGGNVDPALFCTAISSPFE